MMKWLRSLVTDEEWDGDAVLAGVLVTLLFMCFMQYKNEASYDPEKFGQGVAYLLGGGGLGYCAKRIGEKKYADSDSGNPKG